MSRDQKKVVPLTEGKICKGGQNPPNPGGKRPPAPQGSGGKADRKAVLLRAAYDLLKKCDDSYYVKSVLEETAFYDGTDCDGACLLDDIADELGIDAE